MKPQLLLIEDDTALTRSISRFLNLHGYNTIIKHDGKEAYEYLLKNYGFLDLILLDINLPHMNGLDICHKIRNAGVSTPIIMLTTETATDTVVNAFDIGADDYLKKPFNLQELEARVQVQLKSKKSRENKAIEDGDLKVDLSQRIVKYRGEELILRRKEFDILVFLLRNKGHVMSRDTIIANVWSFDEEPYYNTIDAHVSCLRKQLSDSDLKIISTVHGIGYKFNGAG